MTRYNRKTYRIDDIAWDQTPRSTFDLKGTQKSFMDYFREKYGETIRTADQPLLVSRPKKSDVHRGMPEIVSLIPELCVMTGLSDEMRSNFNLMRALGTHLHVGPTQRAQSVKAFMSRLRASAEVRL